MRVYLKDLSKDMQKEIKSILNGNGLKVKDVILHKDGDKIALEMKNTGDIIVIP